MATRDKVPLILLPGGMTQENWLTYEGTVYYSYGSLSADAWEQMRNRLHHSSPASRPRSTKGSTASTPRTWPS